MPGFSALDKTLLSVSGVGLCGLVGAATAWAWVTLAEASVDPPATAQVVARVAQLEGRVKSRHRETLAWTDAHGAQELRDGDRVRTLDAATAEIHYGTGIVVSLDPNTQITVHGPSLTGSDRLIAVDVVDGTIRARVEAGTALTLRDATGRPQAVVRPPETGAAQVVIEAPETPAGAIELEVVEGGSVTVETPEGTQTVIEAEPAVALLATPVPATATPPPATPTPPPTLIKALLPVVISDTVNVRIRRRLPEGVVAVSARGRDAVIHDNGDFELELFGLQAGKIHEVELVYRREDGTFARQVQRIQVR